MFNNLALALIENGRIKTTDAKAKDLRRVADRLVTLGKKGTSDAKRAVYAQFGGRGEAEAGDETRVQRAVDALFGDLAERYKNRPGGYTRVIKIGPRKGDNAPMSFIELVDHDPDAASE
jgi:large subunit ribosomal protein L17